MVTIYSGATDILGLASQIPALSGAPDISSINDLYTDYAQYYQQFHKQCQEEDDYYFGRKGPPVPPGSSINAVIPATARAIVNVATDHVDVNNFSIDVPLASAAAKARAERIKKFYIGAWLASPRPVLRTAVRQAFLYGLSFIKPMFDADKWPDAPILDDFDSEERYREALREFMQARNLAFPLVDMNVNPQNLVWDDSQARMKWAIEFYDMPPKDIHRKYPEWMPKTGGVMSVWKEYWDEKYVAYLADNEIVWGPYEHGYGYVPFVPVYASSSLQYDQGKPEERYQGILKPVHSLLESEARIVTQIEAVMSTVAYRTLDFSGPTAMAKKTADEYQLWGGKNVVPPGVTVSASPYVQVPPDLYQQLDRVQTMIEEATFPNVIRGMRPTGVSTGFGVSVLAGMGRLVFQGVADGLRHAMEVANQCHAKLLENKLKGSLTVHARSDVHEFDQTIRPEDIRGYYENIVQIKAEAPEEREREAILAMRLRQPGPNGMPIISLYEAQRRVGIANPLEEQMQIRAEQLLNTPETIQAQAQMLLEMIGLPTQQEAAVATGSVGGVGARNLGGAQLPRPGEAGIQGQRVRSRMASDMNPSVFPQGMGGLVGLGKQLGMPMGGPVGMPSGETVR